MCYGLIFVLIYCVMCKFCVILKKIVKFNVVLMKGLEKVL